jgi:2,4-dienoyl-CoA reductase-like NADH-dependent reductase (Old Yellow Enzyme family)
MKTLFDKTEIKSMRLENRFVRAATWEGMADENGYPTEKLIKLYEELARGGTGLIITGVAYPVEDSKVLNGMIGIYNDTFIPGYKELTDRVHKHGGKILIQVNYPGRDGKLINPEDLTIDEIKIVVSSFGDAAVRAEKSGFDGIEIHAAHGFFLSRFLTDNKRKDEYGGSYENNSRIIFQIYDDIRAKTKSDFIIFAKVNCVDQIDSEIAFGVCTYLCTELSKKGVNGIEISGQSGEMNGKNDDHYEESIFRDYAAEIAGKVECPVILVGLNRSYSVMNEILNSTGIDYFSLSRPLICQPDLVNMWRSDMDVKPECISCNQCFSADGKACIFH